MKNQIGGVILQGKYEGCVLKVSGESFLARLICLAETRPDKEVKFTISEVSEHDRPLVQPGAIFSLTIRCPKLPGAQRGCVPRLVSGIQAGCLGRTRDQKSKAAGSGVQQTPVPWIERANVA
jgi:hypothetical protein